MKIFKLICKTFGHKFSFNAKNIEDATSKVAAWCWYQGHSLRDYKIEETTDTKLIYNQYIKCR